MRLQISFILLLISAATATSIIWRDFGVAREGDTDARLLIFTMALVALISIALLARIVLKVKNVRLQGREE